MSNDKPVLAGIPRSMQVTKECGDAIIAELQSFLNANNLTLMDVAKKSGMSYHWLYQKVRGASPMTVIAFSRIRAYLDSEAAKRIEFLPLVFPVDVAEHCHDFWQTLADHAMAHPRMTMKSRLARKGRFGVSIQQDTGQIEAGTVVVIDRSDTMPDDGCTAVLFLADNSARVGVYADGGDVVGIFHEGMQRGEEPFVVPKDANGNGLVVAAYKVAGIIAPNGEKTISVPADRIARWKNGRNIAN